MQNEFYNKIDQLNIPNDIKEMLISNLSNGTYVEYKNIEKYIHTLDIEKQNEILSIIIEYNKKLYNKELQIKKELETIQKIKKHKLEITEPNYSNSNDKKIDNLQSTITLDISKYLHDIYEIKTIDELESVLPNTKTENYQDYINLILLSLYKDFKDIDDMLTEDLEDSVRNDFIEELKSIKEKINYIKNYHEEQLLSFNEDEEIVTTNQKNKIIYLTTDSGMPYALKDLKNIDSEHYQSFYFLFNSIINGTFKNSKNFHHDGTNTLIYEVRGYKTRILYDRIGTDTYIILKMLIKKIDNDTYYQTSIADRTTPYKKQKASLRKLLDNPEYLSECDQVTEEILKILKPRTRNGD